jgi:hypothetical protein
LPLKREGLEKIIYPRLKEKPQGMARLRRDNDGTSRYKTTPKGGALNILLEEMMLACIRRTSFRGEMGAL